MPSRFSPHERNVRVALALVLTLVFYAGLSPFNFYPTNQVTKLADGPGAAFGHYGIALTEASSDASDWSAERGFTIELFVTPHATVAGESTALLTFDDGIFPSSLSIRQTGGDLEIFGRWVTAPGWWGRWRLLAEGVLPEGGPHFVTLISDGANGTRIYRDGVLHAHEMENSLIRPDQPFGGQLIIGTRPSGRAGWVGDYRGLAIYDRALSQDEVVRHFGIVERDGFSALGDDVDLRGFYSMVPKPEGNGHVFEDTAPAPSLGSLHAARVFRAPRAPILDVPHRSEVGQRWFVRDVLINILGFAPVSICLLLFLRLHLPRDPGAAVIGAILIGVVLSLLIELGQILLPTRDSSIVDLAFNTLGTLVGVAALLSWEKVRGTSPAAS